MFNIISNLNWFNIVDRTQPTFWEREKLDGSVFLDTVDFY